MGTNSTRMLFAPLQVFLSGDWFKVQSFVAALAQCHTIFKGISQIGMAGKRFDVVRLQVASMSIAALLASITVADIYRLTPLLILNTATVITVSLVFTVAVCVMGLAAFGVRRSQYTGSDVGFFFGRSWNADFRTPFTFLRKALLCPRLNSMCSSFKRGHTSFSRYPLCYFATCSAKGRKSVASTSVLVEHKARMPRFAPCTPFFARVNAIRIIFCCHTNASRCYLQHTLFATHKALLERELIPFNYTSRKVVLQWA